MNKKTLYTLTGCALTLAAAPTITSCSDDDDDAKPAVSFAEGSEKISLSVGDTHQIELINSQNPTYTSEDDYFVSVDETGLVTAKHGGFKTAINVYDSGTTITDSVTVSLTYTCIFDLLYGQVPMELKTIDNVKQVFEEPEETSTNSNGNTNYFWNESIGTSTIVLMVTADETGKVLTSLVRISKEAAQLDAALSSTTRMSIFLKEKYDYVGYASSSYMYSFTPNTRVNYYLSVEYQTKYTDLLYIEKDYFDSLSTSKSLSLENLKSLPTLDPEFSLK